MATYYVPTGKSMGDLRAYTSIEDARAYAIKKMTQYKVIGWSVFSDAGRMNKVGEVHLSMSRDILWIPEGATTKKERKFLYKNGKLDRRQ